VRVLSAEERTALLAACTRARNPPLYPLVVLALVGQTSFRPKLLSYQETWRQGLHKAHLGIPNFRVLTVTTSEERMRHLVAAWRSLRDGSPRLFLFTDQERLARRDILGQEWMNGRSEQVRLFG